jgi:ferredoxin-NADP reductase
VAVLVCLAWGRVIAPLWLNLRHQFAVAEVVDEGPDVVSIYLTGRNLRRAGRAGQFYRWRFLSGRMWLQAHPFSLSAAAHGRWLRLTVKTVGRHTEELRALRPGVRVWAQGPMGSFTAVRRTRGRALLIAAGIGIAPIRALLEELPLGATVIYRASTPDEVLLREELDHIAELRDADVWYVLGAREDPAPRAMLTGAGMQQIVPDVARRDVYLCGPRGFVEAARLALRSAGVPRRQMHDTLFEF